MDTTATITYRGQVRSTAPARAGHPGGHGASHGPGHPCLADAGPGTHAERRRIADELHDVLGVRLVALLLQARRLADHPDAEVRDTSRRLDHLVQQMMSEVRTLVGTLHAPTRAPHRQPVPTAVDDALPCLTTHLAELAASFPDDRVRLDVRHPVPSPALPAEVALAAAHVAAEGIVNAVRHGTGRVDVVVHLADALVVDVRNTTWHADAQASPLPPSGGHGLHAMRRRVEERGGTFHAAHAPDGRFTLRATFDLAPGAARSRA
ncbi:histidine kinase [Cellulomonas flavigena DSM 20109]|uniref:histidine kinase n=1 Tax=Cellulomonas flavigena (strain ATCC 482 / DSM 20109 / BCRC 11376 / JCM 18109 / NBRC 3775 / NCIMB 8073 / NRS 134) TaxID=446466 RepID=D5UC56_CELFN|nr:histidine kinase [Cellulomonas flavigena]ADG76215.1 histidine kinase [Cellulomonas flavigena DSM 20109]